MEPDKKIHRYFRLGDVVKNEDIWGDQLFIIHGFGGNWYCPELYVHFYGKPRSPGRSCNFDVRMTKLVNSSKRPFKKLKKSQLIKLLKTGGERVKEEITRELIIRTNQKYGTI